MSSSETTEAVELKESVKPVKDTTDVKKIELSTIDENKEELKGLTQDTSNDSSNEPPYVEDIDDEKIMLVKPTEDNKTNTNTKYPLMKSPIIGGNTNYYIPNMTSTMQLKELSNTNDAFWNLCKGFVGAASFSLPWAVSQVGIILGIILFIFLAFLCYKTMIWLSLASHYSKPSHNNHHITYPEIAYNSLGNIGKYAAWFCLFFGMIGACGIYILFISDVIKDDLKLFPWVNHKVSVIVILPVVYMLTLIKSFKILAKTAKIGVIIVLLALIITIVDGTYQLIAKDNNVYVETKYIKYFDMSGIPLFVGSALFLFVLHAITLSLEQQMMDRGKYDISVQFDNALRSSIFIVLLTNMIFSTYSYVVFITHASKHANDEVADNVITLLDEGVVQIITKLFLCIDLLFTYAIIMYPFVEALELYLWNIKTQITYSTDRRLQWKRRGLRLFLVILTGVLAIVVPHFGYLTGLTGGISGILAGFILPPAIYYKLCSQRFKDDKLEYGLVVGIFIFGVVMFFVTPAIILNEMYSK